MLQNSEDLDLVVINHDDYGKGFVKKCKVSHLKFDWTWLIPFSFWLVTYDFTSHRYNVIISIRRKTYIAQVSTASTLNALYKTNEQIYPSESHK